MDRHFLCIDLKSFFASCECLDRGLNPFTTPLVVADPRRGGGAITLAVTPYLKNLGVKSRGRIFEIDKKIKYTIAPPRMSLYINKSKEVMSIYLDFVASEDLHIYSIDEAFLDVTDYLKLYNMTDYELALTILKTVTAKTGLTATCGIGPNMLIAKVAMDIEAKHSKDNIAKWTTNNVPDKLWPITPLSNFWGIGRGLEKRLNNLGINSIGDLAKYDPRILKQKLGVIGEQLWAHANGIDHSRINELNPHQEEKSYSHSQILFKDYYRHNIKLIINEMVEALAVKLRANHKMTSGIGFGIGYSKEINDGFYRYQKLIAPTDDEKAIVEICVYLFEEYYEDLPIRRVAIAFGGLVNKTGYQLNLFEDPKEVENNFKLATVSDEIKSKYGKNSLLKATSLLSDSTIKERNGKIGGHGA